MHFPIVIALASFFLSGVYAAPSCTDTSDHHMNGSTRNNTLDAGMDLIAFFNDPARNGVLSLPAQGAKSTYSVSRQVGWVHVGLYIADYTKPVDQEDIPLTNALNALLELISTCTAGSASIGKGQWHFSVSEENHVGKREHMKSTEVQKRSDDPPLVVRDNLEKRADTAVQSIGNLAAWPVLRLGLEDETSWYGTNIVSFSDAAENPLVDAVAAKSKDIIHQNSGNANLVSIGGPNDIYKAKFTLTGFSNWGDAESTIKSRGDEGTLIDKLLENTMHNTADRRSVLGRFKWEFEAPTGTKAGKAINVVVVRVLMSTPTQTSCDKCDCKLGDAKPRVDMPSEGELSEAPDDFPKNKPSTTEEQIPPSLPITKASGATRRSTLSARRAERVTKNSKAAGHLFRRYGTCNVQYENNNYPSTATSAQLPPNQDKADGNPQITKWIDWEIRANGQTQQICDWRLVQNPSRTAGREYATEHVFEKHLIASFLKWAQKALGLCVRANCAKVNQVFNTRSTTGGSPFANQVPAASMALALSDNTRVNEFFILRDTVNTAKTVILSWNAGFQGVPAIYIADPWQTTLQTIRTYSMAMNYMNDPAVSTIFANTNQRMRTILQHIDGDNFYPRPNTCQDDHGDQTPGSWEGLWEEWIGKFITYKEIKMQNWIRNSAVPTLRDQITAQVADPVVRAQMLSDVNYFQQQGRWMSGGAFQFSNTYHTL